MSVHETVALVTRVLAVIHLSWLVAGKLPMPGRRS
jgi:hypothetical protein